MTLLEKRIAHTFEREYCIYTGSGTTAMYLTFLALNRQSKKVVFPNITCLVAVNAAIYAGYEVVFCDVNLEDYTYDHMALKSILESENIGIVVATHIYGNLCDMSWIKPYLDQNNIFILEDSAQSIYTHEYGASIVSFGHSKILENKEKGGACLLDDKTLYKEIKSVLQHEANSLNKGDTTQLFTKYREEYYKIMKSSWTVQNKNRKLYELQMNSRPIFLTHQEHNNQIEGILKQISLISEKRIQRQSLYNTYMNKKYIQVMDDMTNYPRWRYSFLYKGDRDKLLEEVRKRDVDISSWYPCVDQVYNKENITSSKNALLVSQQIVNLWCHQDYSLEKIKTDIQTINECMEACYESEYNR